jgi:hypothetical protein
MNTTLPGVMYTAPYSTKALKGTVSRDNLLLVFFMNQFPPAPEYPIWTVLNFSKIRGDIRRSRLTTGVVDTGCK